MPTTKIILLKPLTVNDLMIGRMLKPFYDNNLLVNIKSTDVLKLVSDIVNTHPHDAIGFNHLFKKTKPTTTPSEIYNRILSGKDVPSGLILYINDNDKVTGIAAANSYRDIRSTLKTLVSRGILETNLRLEGEDDDED